MDKDIKVAVYFRTATTPIEQKVWLYASSKHSEQTELRDLNVEAMKHTARQNGLVVAGVSTDSSRQLPSMERPGVQEMLSAVREGRVGAVMMPSILAGISMRSSLCWPNFKSRRYTFTPKTPLRFPFRCLQNRPQGGKGATHGEFSVFRPPHVAVQP